jgi:putative transposase
MKWVTRSRIVGDVPILTRSSKPKKFRAPIKSALADRIKELRRETKRCTEAIHAQLKREGVSVSRSTVHRTLDRAHLLKKRSPYWRHHPPVERPRALRPGDLVELDAIHLMTGRKTRIYVYALIDTYSRWTYARCVAQKNTRTATLFLKQALHEAPFPFHMIQTDHGSEFGTAFVRSARVPHRYTRLGKPNDNAHIERFNRTLQEECLDRIERDVVRMNRALKKYLSYYNHHRLHLGINACTPMEMVPRC